MDDAASFPSAGAVGGISKAIVNSIKTAYVPIVIRPVFIARSLLYTRVVLFLCLPFLLFFRNVNTEDGKGGNTRIRGMH